MLPTLLQAIAGVTVEDRIGSVSEATLKRDLLRREGPAELQPVRISVTICFLFVSGQFNAHGSDHSA